MIDGLKLTMTGAELRTKLDERIAWHARELRRHPQHLKDSSSNAAGVAWPERVLQGEIATSEKQIEVLTLIRDYIIADEVYRLGEFDLRFADLLPEDDGWDCGCVAATAGRVEDRMHDVTLDGTELSATSRVRQ